MRRFLIILVLCAAWLVPQVAHAQNVAPTPLNQGLGEGIEAGQLLAIGAGVIVGSVVLETVAMGHLSSILGGVLGGVVGNWWYNQSRAIPIVNKTVYRESSASGQDLNKLKIVKLLH